MVRLAADGTKQARAASRLGLALVAFLVGTVGCLSGSRPAPQARVPEAKPGGASASSAQAAAPTNPTDQPDGQGRAERVQAASQREPSPAWLGVKLATNSGGPGVRVERVMRRSPSEAAGLLPGDLLLRLDAATVERPEDVVLAMQKRRSGESLTVALLRGEQQHLLRVELSPMPDREGMLHNEFFEVVTPELGPLLSVQGEPVATLQSLRGQVVVLEFWAPWCVACRLMIPTLNDWHRELGPQGLRLLSISDSHPQELLPAVQALGIAYPVSSDTTGETIAAFQASVIPTLFVVDRAGVIRQVSVGLDPVRLRELRQVLEGMLAR